MAMASCRTLPLSVSREMFKDNEKKIAECSNEECVFDSPLCINCNGYMIERKGKYGEFLACSQYSKCKHTETIRS
jgi:ssDNA-binding Zn-finger/Zn-ribbon topoisomerase 1